MNIEKELEKFHFREPPPFLREEIQKAAREKSHRGRRSYFWRGATAAAVLLVAVTAVGNRLDRQWTSALVNSVEPYPATTYAAEPSTNFRHSGGFTLEWSDGHLAILLAGEPNHETNRSKENGS